MPVRAWSGVAALVAVLVGALLSVVPGAQAAPPTYVALGDSCSSGTGTRTYLLDGTTCQRSVAAYPSLLASAAGYALNLDALRHRVRRGQRRGVHRGPLRRRPTLVGRGLRERHRQGRDLRRHHPPGCPRLALRRDPLAGAVGHGGRGGLPEWVNGLSSPASESYHPKASGHRDGYLPVVGSLLTGSAVTATSATLEAAWESATRLAQQQRRYADRDRGMEPETFRAPRR